MGKTSLSAKLLFENNIVLVEQEGDIVKLGVKDQNEGACVDCEFRWPFRIGNRNLPDAKAPHEDVPCREFRVEIPNQNEMRVFFSRNGNGQKDVLTICVNGDAMQATWQKG